MPAGCCGSGPAARSPKGSNSAQLLAAEAALPEDGASRALGATGPLPADPELHAALQTRSGLIVSADLFYDPDAGRPDRWRAAGALAVEMEAATLFAVAARHGLPAACLLVVSDIVATRERIGPDELLAAEEDDGPRGARRAACA